MKILLIAVMSAVLLVGAAAYVHKGSQVQFETWKTGTDTQCCPETMDGQKLKYAKHYGNKDKNVKTQTDCYYQDGKTETWKHSCWY